VDGRNRATDGRQRLRVVVADDDPVVRRALRDAIQAKVKSLFGIELEQEPVQIGG